VNAARQAVEPAAGPALAAARAVADAVLYEGYVLYPYRASAAKNAVRWQWGVLMPEDAVAADPSERSANRTDLLVDGRATGLRLTVRFLQVQQRYVEDARGERVDRLEVGDATYVPWDEARDREVVREVPLDADGTVLDTTLDVDGGHEEEALSDGAGRLVRVCRPLRLRVTAEVRHAVSPYPVALVTLRVRNLTPPGPDPGGDRPAWLRRALVACHLLAELDAGAFLSQLDPPEWARGFVADCAHDGLFPVLAGPAGQERIVLGSPIILYDHPELAPESEHQFFDGLEIDELLALRTMTLSEEEKREVRGTDPRVADLLGAVDALPPEVRERLHGRVRQLDAMTAVPAPGAMPGEDVPWWDPGSDDSVDPERDAVRVGDVDVRRGTRVVLRPGVRRADAYDLFLAGRAATVAAVLHDVDGQLHLAVTVDEDPGSDLKASHGRYLYFAPDEVEPIDTARSSPQEPPFGEVGR
jgi:hypothetical protein